MSEMTEKQRFFLKNKGLQHEPNTENLFRQSKNIHITVNTVFQHQFSLWILYLLLCQMKSNSKSQNKMYYDAYLSEYFEILYLL